MPENKIAIFQKKEIRKIIHNNEWWFVVNDVITALTGSKNPAQYFKRMKSRDNELKKLIEQGGVQFVPPLQLKIETSGGLQKMYCWNTEGIFRLIQSIPSPKAELFDVDRSVITKHIGNIYKDNELQKEATIAKIEKR